MTRGRLVVHGHFYQPSRTDPFTGSMPAEPEAAPYHDWNERVDAECYRANAERGNLARISYDLGPTLASWLAAADPATYRAFIASDAPQAPVVRATPPPTTTGNAMAQSYHHSILPLASMADRRTEVRWGIRDFELRFGRRPTGLWLPETAVDLPTLRILAEAGITWTILAPWQSVEQELDTRRPYRVSLGGGRSIVVVFYDGALSGQVSFDPSASADADQFTRERLLPRFATPMRGARGHANGAGVVLPPAPGMESPLIVIATDGELYGHHQKFRDLFLQRLVDPPPGTPERSFDLVTLADEVIESPDDPFETSRIIERTSWSCHHGVARWSAECPDAADGRWKGPLRAALERLAGGVDQVAERVLRGDGLAVSLADARDAYVDVVAGAETADAFATRHLGARVHPATRERFTALLDAQRWRLAMFASDAWFWDDPNRPETRQVLRTAACAARRMDDVAGTDLEARLMADLTLFDSPSRGVDGLEIYREALAEVGQPVS